MLFVTRRTKSVLNWHLVSSPMMLVTKAVKQWTLCKSPYKIMLYRIFRSQTLSAYWQHLIMYIFLFVYLVTTSTIFSNKTLFINLYLAIFNITIMMNCNMQHIINFCKILIWYYAHVLWYRHFDRFLYKLINSDGLSRIILLLHIKQNNLSMFYIMVS